MSEDTNIMHDEVESAFNTNQPVVVILRNSSMLKFIQGKLNAPTTQDGFEARRLVDSLMHLDQAEVLDIFTS